MGVIQADTISLDNSSCAKARVCLEEAARSSSFRCLLGLLICRYSGALAILVVLRLKRLLLRPNTRRSLGSSASLSPQMTKHVNTFVDLIRHGRFRIGIQFIMFIHDSCSIHATLQR